jgi:hypothetical protein
MEAPLVVIIYLFFVCPSLRLRSFSGVADFANPTCSLPHPGRLPSVRLHALTAMRLLYCATLVFSIIPDASKRVAASPLPVVSDQEWLMPSRSSSQFQFLDRHVPESRQSSSGGYPVEGSLPVATKGATTAALQVALENPGSISSSPKSRSTSSHRSSHRTSLPVNSAMTESELCEYARSAPSS